MEDPEATSAPVPEPVPTVEGLSSLKETAVQLNEIYMELVDSGFTENQALFLASQLLVNSVYIGPTYRYNDTLDGDEDLDLDEDEADGDFI